MKTQTIFAKSRKFVVPILVYLILLPFIMMGIRPVSAPITEVETYKGLWMASINVVPSMHPMAWDFERMRQDGVNAVHVTAVHYGLGNRIFAHPWSKALMITYIQAAHRNGLNVFLSLELSYGPLGLLIPQHKVPKDVLDNTDFLEKLTTIAVEWAEVAERYSVEMFSPLAEPEAKLDAEGFKWSQAIITQIRAAYSGILVYRGAVPGHWQELGANFKGYDYLGFTMGTDQVNLEEVSDTFDRYLGIAAYFAERDGVEKIMINELGQLALTTARTAYELASATDIIFERAKGRITGYFVSDVPPMFGTTFKGTEIEEVTRHWFLEELP